MSGRSGGLAPRALLLTYMAGFFSLSLLQMVAMATPLWSSHLGLSALMIGLAAGSRSIAPLVYSIHLGSLLDAVGVRRIMLFFAVQCALLPLLYPLLPYGTAFLLLQLFLGLASATAWLAAQTAIARNAGGDSSKTGWFSFFTSAGTVAGPLLLGFVWTHGSPTAGYLLLSVWGFLLLAASVALPRRRDVVRKALRPSDFIPRISNYTSAFRVLKKPVAAFVIACTFLRLGSVSMVESFYPVLVQGLGFSAATIGVLFAIGNFTSSPSSLLASWWVRVCGSSRLALVISVALSIGAVSVAPFLGAFWMLALAMAVYGFGLGVSMPLIFTLLSQGVDPDQQGVTAGLRATANRMAAFLLPVLIGLLAELAGVAGAFWAMGLAMLALLVAVEAVFRRRI